MSDGYFRLTALDPPALGIGGGAGGFNYNQSALLGLKPRESGSRPAYIMYCTGEFVPSATSASLGDEVEFAGGFFNMSFTTMPAGSEVGIRIEPVSPAGEPQYITCATDEIMPGYGAQVLAAAIPSKLAAGTYRVTPAYKVAGRDWEEMRARLSDNGELTATVSGSTISFTAPEAPELSVSDLRLTTPLYWGKGFELSFTLTNEKEAEYYGGLTPILLTADGTEIVAQSTPYPIDLEGGQTHTATYGGTFRANSAPAAGTYLLALYNSATQSLVGEPTEVTLNAAPAETDITVSDLRIISEQPIENTREIQFAATVECTAGYYDGTVALPVFSSDGGESLAVASSGPLYLEAGNSRDVEFTLDLSTLPAGSYMAAVYSGQTAKSAMLHFELPEQAAQLVPAATAPTATALYDLQGRRVTHPRPGLYATPAGLRRL